MEYPENHFVLDEGKPNSSSSEVIKSGITSDPIIIPQKLVANIGESIKCNLCDKSFKRLNHLKLHLRGKIHKAETEQVDSVRQPLNLNKPLLNNESLLNKISALIKCKICDKTFTKLLTLKLHVRSKLHQNSKQCGICGNVLESSKEVAQHLRKFHELRVSISKKKSKVQCKFCRRILSSPNALQRHIGIHLGETPYKCKFCPKAYTNGDILKLHEQTHGERHLKCQLCPAAFHWPLSLKRHLILKHSNKKESNQKHTISKDSPIFETLQSLKEHIGTMESAKSDRTKKKSPIKLKRRPKVDNEMKCTLCGKKYTKKKYLNRHLKRHEELINPKYKCKGPYECEICKEKFALKTKYLKHLKTHGKMKSKKVYEYECKLCTKTCSTPYGLDEHMATHTLEKTFVCEICGQGFGVRRTLQLHYGTHTKEKPFPCRDCGKCFKRANTLKRHFQTAHTKERPFKCDFCERDFNRKDVLMDHLRYHTGEKPFKCTLCKKMFSTYSLMLHHKIKHEEGTSMTGED